MDINFELYKIFYHAARLNSFTEAAGQLFISQSAVSQAIRNLEDKLGSRLFYRKSRNMALTAEGELLLRHVEQAYNFIRIAESKINEIQNLNLGEVRIGTSDTVCKYSLISYLEHFNKLYPGIKIQVINRTSFQILSLLKNGLVDFGIVTLPVTGNNLVVEEFTSLEDIFVASDKYSELKGKEIDLQRLSDYPLLMLERNSATRQLLDSFLAKFRVEITPEIELESVDLLVEFAKIGLGIAHVLKESAALAMERGELFQVRTLQQLPLRKLGIVSTPDVPLSRASGEFIRLLKEGTGGQVCCPKF